MKYALWMLMFFINRLAYSQSVDKKQIIDSLVTAVNKSKDSTKGFIPTMAKALAIKEYLPHEKPKVAFARSMLFPGWGQITNKDFWKVSFIWAAAAGDIYFGIIQNNQRYNQYLGYYKQHVYLGRGKVFLYSADGVPITMPVASEFYVQLQPTKRFPSNILTVNKDKLFLKNEEKMHQLAFQNGDVFEAVPVTDPGNLTGPYNAQVFENAKNQFRKYRDLSIIAFAAGWLVQALEANVAAHLKTFDMSSNISLRVKPAGIETFGTAASGLSLCLTIK